MNNNLMYIILAVVVLLIVAVVIYMKGSSGGKQYQLKTFLTKNEKDCFQHLSKIFPEYHICPQVSMGAVLEPIAKMSSASASERSLSAINRNKIGSKIIDFIILNAQLEPIFIIELDDNTHNSKVDKDRERDLNFKEAGLKTVRFRRVKNTFPSRSDIEKQLK